jgi:hypothetical protein
MATYTTLAYDNTNKLPVLPSSSDTVSIPNDLAVSGDATITGNLTVNGTTTTVNSEIITADRSIVMNTDYTADAVEDAYIVAVTDPDAPSTAWNSDNYNIFIENKASIKFQGSTAPSSDAQWPSAGDLVLIKGNPNAADNGIYEVKTASTFGGSAYILIKSPNATVGADQANPSADVAGFVLDDITNYGDSSTFLPSGFEIVPVKVVGFKTDSANNAVQSIVGSTGGSMTINTLAAGGTAADDITAGDAAVEITTTSGDIVIDSPTGQAVRLQVNGDDKIVLDGDDIQIKAGKNLLVEDTAAVATQLTVAGSSAVAAFDTLYINTSGELAPADADGAGLHYNIVGVALEAGPSGAAAVKQVMTTCGQVTGAKFTSNPSSGDQGKAVYLSTTAGQVSLTAPSASGDKVVRIGFLYSSTALSTGVYPVIWQPQFINTVA